MAFFCAKKKYAQYSFVLPTMYPRSTLGPRASSKTATSYWKSLSSRSKSFHLLVWLCPSLLVPPYIASCFTIILSGSGQRHLAPHWNVPSTTDYNRIFWLKLNTSLACSFVHQVKIHSVPRYYFLKYILVKNPHVDMSRLPIPKFSYKSDSKVVRLCNVLNCSRALLKSALWYCRS